MRTNLALRERAPLGMLTIVQRETRQTMRSNAPGAIDLNWVVTASRLIVRVVRDLPVVDDRFLTTRWLNLRLLKKASTSVRLARYWSATGSRSTASSSFASSATMVGRRWPYTVCSLLRMEKYRSRSERDQLSVSLKKNLEFLDRSDLVCPSLVTEYKLLSSAYFVRPLETFEN